MPPITVLALHGFAGAGADFAQLADITRGGDIRWVCPDLPGHGSNRLTPEELDALSFRATDAYLAETFDRLHGGERWLLGYSMGGRIALHAVSSGAVKPDRLLLIGASPGLSPEVDRGARIHLEESWAARIEGDGMPRFAEYWKALPIIQSQETIPEPWRSAMRERRATQDSANMAAVLRHLGSGRMPSLWSALNHIPCPVEVITGALDEKFCEVAASMLPLLKAGRHTVIPDAGHTAHLERIAVFATWLQGISA